MARKEDIIGTVLDAVPIHPDFYNCYIPYIVYTFQSKDVEVACFDYHDGIVFCETLGIEESNQVINIFDIDSWKDITHNDKYCVMYGDIIVKINKNFYPFIERKLLKI